MAEPLAFIYPSNVFWSDNPLCILDQNLVTTTRKDVIINGLMAFSEHLRQPENQAAAISLGFRPRIDLPPSALNVATQPNTAFKVENGVRPQVNIDNLPRLQVPDDTIRTSTVAAFNNTKMPVLTVIAIDTRPFLFLNEVIRPLKDYIARIPNQDSLSLITYNNTVVGYYDTNPKGGGIQSNRDLLNSVADNLTDLAPGSTVYDALIAATNHMNEKRANNLPQGIRRAYRIIFLAGGNNVGGNVTRFDALLNALPDGKDPTQPHITIAYGSSILLFFLFFFSFFFFLPLFPAWL
jgi:hypothetical protein